jgi:hypothetical protein
MHVLTHPERVIFVDQVGVNTSQNQDEHIRGRKLVVVNLARSQERNAYTDCHVTFLGFTTMNGEPIICDVVVAVKRLTALEASGFNPMSK